MNKLSLLVSLLLIYSVSAQQKQSKTGGRTKAAVTPLPALHALDSYVILAVAQKAQFGALDLIERDFERCATAIRSEAEAAYRHRLERKETEKRYRVEIEYAYYQAMIKAINSMKGPQAILDKERLDPGSVEKTELMGRQKELSALAARLAAIHKRCPIRRQGATKRPQAQAKTSGRTR